MTERCWRERCEHRPRDASIENARLSGDCLQRVKGVGTRDSLCDDARHVAKQASLDVDKRGSARGSILSLFLKFRNLTFCLFFALLDCLRLFFRQWRNIGKKFFHNVRADFLSLRIVLFVQFLLAGTGNEFPEFERIAFLSGPIRNRMTFENVPYIDKHFTGKCAENDIPMFPLHNLPSCPIVHGTVAFRHRRMRAFHEQTFDPFDAKRTQTIGALAVSASVLDGIQADVGDKLFGCLEASYVFHVCHKRKRGYLGNPRYLHDFQHVFVVRDDFKDFPFKVFLSFIRLFICPKFVFEDCLARRGQG